MMNHKFQIGQTVRHKKGGLYKILVLPDPDDLLEDCHEPFYKYLALYGEGKKWNRRVSQMEDGRFTLVEE